MPERTAFMIANLDPIRATPTLRVPGAMGQNARRAATRYGDRFACSITAVLSFGRVCRRSV
jgi:hypothetical protein